MALSGLRFIVTGASSGFGAEIARRATKQGAKLVLVDLNRDSGEKLVRELSPHRAAFVQGSITDSTTWSKAKEVAQDVLGGVDVVVNNAGWSHSNKTTLDVTEAEFNKLFDVNVKSVFHSVRAFVPLMIQQGVGGAFVNVGSVTSLRPRPGLSWYASSKGALSTATKALATDYATHNIRFNTVSPTLSVTGLTSTFTGMASTPENNAKWLATIPLGRLGEPPDIAEAVLFLASKNASFITGVELPVDGGRHI